MHTMWKGSISFGLVNIPIKMFASTDDKDIKFKYLHKECRTPIKQQRTCPTCEREVEWNDIVKGFEYEPGRFVIIEDEEIEAIKPDATKAIEILDFVNLSEIDPIYFNKSYYLSPQDTGGKAYHLLRQAMNDSGKIGIAKITIRTKESLAALRVYKNLLVLETIFYPDEIRAVELVPGVPDNIKLEQKELDMAVHLIDNLTTEFAPEKYKDEYRESLQELIAKKIEGEEIEIAKEPPRRNIIDLMQALQASIEETEKVQKGKKKQARNRQTKTTVG